MSWHLSVEDEERYVSALAFGEVRRGIEILRAKDPPHAAAIERWLGTLIEVYADRILPVDRDVADAWGRLNVKRTLPAVDGLVVATALVHDLTLVTRNTRDVRGTGVDLLNPFEV